MHCVSTGLMLIGVQKMIAETVPDHQTGGAQGIAYFTTNTAMAATTLASGWLYERFGADGFYFMALVAAAGLAAAFAARRVAQPQSAGSGGWISDPS
jgi:MFS transporter, PPP family, 3-phenylpropionic acid transporter